MEVYVKGMEMPETCKLCYLSEFDPGFYAYVCKPTGIRIDCDMAKIDRPRTICPLAHVPPHGRLIDADKMRESIRRQAGLLKLMGGELSDLAETLEKGFLQEIDNAPTIIPAEEEST